VSSRCLTVVVSTYAWPEALDLALRALADVVDPGVEVIVADDGSGPETMDVVRRWRDPLGKRLRVVRQEDESWRLARLRNLAALAARGEYLVFLDGDCLVRRGFVDAVRRAALPGWFLAGKRLHLSRALSRRVLETQLPLWRWSAARWLVHAPSEVFTSHREAGSLGTLLPVRDRRRPWKAGQPDFRPPYDAYGFFFGVHREDFERANGFDMRFVGWGGEDVELATRLRRFGLRCGWPGPQATLVHLWHPVRKGTMRSNAPLLAGTRASARVEAALGLRELAAEIKWSPAIRR
jgi:glycosyltransferase involved in cell wall biosynthesis